MHISSTRHVKMAQHKCICESESDEAILIRMNPLCHKASTTPTSTIQQSCNSAVFPSVFYEFRLLIYPIYIVQYISWTQRFSGNIIRINACLCRKSGIKCQVLTSYCQNRAMTIRTNYLASPQLVQGDKQCQQWEIKNCWLMELPKYAFRCISQWATPNENDVIMNQHKQEY